MKLGTLVTSNGPQPVLVAVEGDASRYYSVEAIDSSLPGSVKELIGDAQALSRLADAVANGLPDGALVEGKLTAPIPDPGKVICIGLNYRDHAEETGMAIPEEPVCFGKFANTIIGPDDEIRLPKVSEQVDFEAELVIVIGPRGKNIDPAQALDHVAGYTNGHDVSARDWQIGKPGKQWMLGKTPDTFAPIGPYVATRDEIPDPAALSIQLKLNGEVMQDGHTSQFIFGVGEIVSYLSQIMTLEPGDLIFTGTPAGVGMGRKPPVWLKPGDVTEVTISGLGTLRNPIVAE